MLKPTTLADRLESDRLIVRVYQDADARQLFDTIERNREVMRRWLPFVETKHQSPEESIEAVRAMRDRIARLDDYTVGLFSRDDRLLGGTGLHRFDWDLGRCEIGYWLSEDAQGHGYVTEAAWRLACYAFDDLGAERVEIRADVENAPSRAVAERLGFPLEGILRRIARLHGEMRDHALYALVRSDYEERTRAR